MNKNWLTFITVVMGLLLLYSNSDLFLRLEEYNGKTMTPWRISLNILLSAAFSTLTAVSIRFMENEKYVKIMATSDAIALFLHFQSNIPPYWLNWIGAVFFAAMLWMSTYMIFKLCEAMRAKSQATAGETPSAETAETAETATAEHTDEVLIVPAETADTAAPKRRAAPKQIANANLEELTVDEITRKAIKSINGSGRNPDRIKNWLDRDDVPEQTKITIQKTFVI